MKKCPTCGKEFEDSMKFCQLDGTPLPEAAADEPAFDPYATMVSIPKGAVPEGDASSAEPVGENSMSSVPISQPDDLLDLPQVDPLKTMAISDDEMKLALDEIKSGGEPEQPAMPAPPEFIAPATQEPEPPSFGDMSPPPSPFGTSDPEPAPSTTYDEPATIVQSFDPPASQPVQEWTPPPAPDASWQGQQIGSNTPFQPPPAGVGGENKTLAIVSLILGIISICCYVSPITGIAAIITGFLAMKNVNNDPNTYGGKGLAIAGMVCGAVFLVIGVVYYILLVLGFASGAFR